LLKTDFQVGSVVGEVFEEEEKRLGQRIPIFYFFVSQEIFTGSMVSRKFDTNNLDKNPL